MIKKELVVVVGFIFVISMLIISNGNITGYATLECNGQQQTYNAEFTGQHIAAVASEQQIIEGEFVFVDVMIYEGTNVYGYDLTIEYDPTILRFVEMNDGNYLGTNEGTDFLCVDYSESNGIISNVACTKTGTELSQGDGVLKTLIFESINEGYVEIGVESEVGEWEDVIEEESTPIILNYNNNNEGICISSNNYCGDGICDYLNENSISCPTDCQENNNSNNSNNTNNITTEIILNSPQEDENIVVGSNIIFSCQTENADNITLWTNINRTWQKNITKENNTLNHNITINEIGSYLWNCQISLNQTKKFSNQNRSFQIIQQNNNNDDSSDDSSSSSNRRSSGGSSRSSSRSSGIMPYTPLTKENETEKKEFERSVSNNFINITIITDTNSTPTITEVDKILDEKTTLYKAYKIENQIEETKIINLDVIITITKNWMERNGINEEEISLELETKDGMVTKAEYQKIKEDHGNIYLKAKLTSTGVLSITGEKEETATINPETPGIVEEEQIKEEIKEENTKTMLLWIVVLILIMGASSGMFIYEKERNKINKENGKENINKNYNETKEKTISPIQQYMGFAFRNLNGKTTINNFRNKGYKDEQIKEIINEFYKRKIQNREIQEEMLLETLELGNKRLFQIYNLFVTKKEEELINEKNTLVKIIRFEYPVFDINKIEEKQINTERT